MLRERVLQNWSEYKKKVFKLKAKSIDNYTIVNKRAILELENTISKSPLTVCDFLVVNGKVTNKKSLNRKSYNVVEINTQLLKVAIIEELKEDYEEFILRNYEGEIDYEEYHPPLTINEVD